MYTVESKGKQYGLHTRKVELRGGRKQQIYFFSPTDKKPKSGRPVKSLPQGYKVVKNKRTGLPVLKKK